MLAAGHDRSATLAKSDRDVTCTAAQRVEYDLVSIFKIGARLSGSQVNRLLAVFGEFQQGATTIGSGP